MMVGNELLAGNYFVRSGSLDWSGTATCIDNAIDQALYGCVGRLGEVICIGVPKATPTTKRRHLKHYMWTANVIALRRKP